MPTQSERVVNRALSGTELKSYIREAFNKLLDNEGMLSEHIAFGRVGGIIKLTLLLDNAYFPEATSSITVGEQLTPEGKLKDPSSEMEVAQQTASFTMDNPNAERVRLGLPIPVETKQLDGTKQIEHLIYPKDDVEDLPPRQVTIEDTTIKAKKDLGL